MNTYFENLTENDISVHHLLNLQKNYPNLSSEETAAYDARIDLRVSLLIAFAKKNHLPIIKKHIQNALSDVPNSALQHTLEPIKESASPRANTQKPTVTLLNGGPASGKSRWVRRNPPTKDTVILDRDSYFDQLPPYPRLKHTHPAHATHVVVCEAILYNERDAYRYALLSGANHLLVDGTMSYRDLGHEMIDNAKDAGYLVRLIHVDCDIDLAIMRAEERAAKTGKTINTKLLYESHVRCTYNFLEYREKVHEAESWNTDNDAPELIATHTDILNKNAFNTLKSKSTLPLDNPSWPPNFDEFLEQR